MGIHHFSSTAFNFNGFQGGYGSIQEEIMFQGKHSFSGMELLGETDPLPSGNNGKGTNLFKEQNQQEQQHELKVDDMILEDINFDPNLQPTHPFDETTGLKNQGVSSPELAEAECNKQEAPSSLTIASLELLRNYGTKFKKLSGENISDNFSNIDQTCLDDHNQKLSTEEIIRVAGARYVHYSAHWNDNFCIPMHPYGLDLGSLSEEENRDVELAQFLLAAAERVGCQQYERASRLLLHCQWNSDANANAAQRVIFHFAEALRERINKETGRVVTSSSSCYGHERNEERELLLKLDTNKSLTCHQKMPFNQVMQFTGVQAMVEHVACETKIHHIDLDIRSGVQCTALMQALADRKDWAVKFFKVSAIGTTECKAKIEETGQRLSSFAQSLNLPFSYKAIIVNDMAEIKVDHFDIEDDEAVVVYSPYFLRTLVSRPDCLENLMLVVRNIKPSIMIVLEVDANHNTPSFVNRFIEALFFYSAFFDCLETCMEQEQDTECRVATEAILSVGIRNIVATEGRERTVRNVKIDVWRRFFSRYKMVEAGFSESSIYQANLVAKEFAFGKFCTLDNNGKSLIVGWKGTPMHSLSAWRFA